MALDDLNPFAENPPQAAVGAPVQGPNIMEQWGQALQDPGMRASLMQFGMQMMQPMGFGQTPMGHLGMAMGAGGEAATRVQEEDLKTQLAQNKLRREEEELDIARGTLGIRQQEADTRKSYYGAKAAQPPSGRGVSSLTTLRLQNEESKHYDKKAKERAASIYDEMTAGIGAPNPANEIFRGKSKEEITSMLKADPNWTKSAREERERDILRDIPPPQYRQQGMVYMTPRGPMTWGMGKNAAGQVVPGWVQLTPSSSRVPREARPEEEED